MAEDEISSCVGEIRIGGWGWEGGNEAQNWHYKPEDGIIRQIIVSQKNDWISSITFIDGSMKYSPEFGTASDDDLTTQININHPTEYLTGVSMLPPTQGSSFVRELRFHTNVRQYDATMTQFVAYDDDFYNIRNRNRVELQMEGGKVVGFHGHSSSYSLSSIGVYVMPIYSSVRVPAQITACEERQHQVNIFNDSVLRYPGPWGSCGGKHWDDGFFPAVKRIHLYFTLAIHGIHIQYLRRDGRSIWSPRHGSKSQNVVKIKIDGDDEFLIGLGGFYGRMNGYKGCDNGGVEVIKSLTFYTNKETYGPYGDENGNYFTSIACGNAKVVGFRGSSGTYLNAIGVHLEYFS